MYPKDTLEEMTDKIHLSSEVPIIDLSMLSNADEDELNMHRLVIRYIQKNFYHNYTPRGRHLNVCLFNVS